jgi:hypothetical protein
MATIEIDGDVYEAFQLPEGERPVREQVRENAAAVLAA